MTRDESRWLPIDALPTDLPGKLPLDLVEDNQARILLGQDGSRAPGLRFDPTIGHRGDDPESRRAGISLNATPLATSGSVPSTVASRARTPPTRSHVGQQPEDRSHVGEFGQHPIGLVFL